MNDKLLNNINLPKDLRELDHEQLGQVCDELRAELIDIVSQIGGHLGAGLGVVELTVALHYVFNTPNDKLIWDVGHQSYPHKILTGRKGRMLSLRQKGGLSGFTKQKESEYDPFGAGHSSTSISAALGMAVADRLAGKEDSKAIAVIGDGAMSAGMAYEAMNNATYQIKDSNLIVVLNDNDMSIGRPTGAMSTYLAKLISSKSYLSFRDLTKKLVGSLPNLIESTIINAKKRAKEIVTEAVHGNNLFEQLGFFYLGPVDGHNINDLVDILTNIRDHKIGKPILLHVVTKKGYGYKYAEESLDKFHGVSKFDVPTGKQAKKSSNLPSYTKIFSDSLIKHAAKDKKITAITAAMPDGTGLDKFAEKFPERYFDVGIAEQHAVTFAAGLACKGYKPFVAIYSTFLQRAYDQIVHDVAIQNLPVKFAIDRCGYVGADGATHAGSFDIAYLSNLPGMVVMAASDEQELVHMVATAAQHDTSPIAFRYPRGEVTGMKLKKAEILEIGKGRVIGKGKEIAILSLGSRLGEVRQAADMLQQGEGIAPTIVDMRFAKPFDKVLVKKIIKTHKKIIIIEEGASGGFASHILEWLGNEKLLHGLHVKSLNFPDKFIDQMSPEEMYKEASLDKESILKAMKEVRYC